MFGGNAPSLSDIAAVTGNRNNGDGFGDGNGWWVLIILFALFGGWGNGGYGNGRGNNGGNTEVVVVPTQGYGSGVMGYGYGFQEAAIQRGFDNQAVINKLDGLTQGLCDVGYSNLAQFNGVNSNIMQMGFANERAIQNQTIAQMQDTNALSRQLGDCCCENRQAIAQVNYNMATQACETRQAIANSTRDIIEVSNNNYRALHDEFVAYQLSQKDEKIAELTALNAALSNNISQAGQTNEIRGIVNNAIQTMRDCPIPSFNAPNPNCCYSNGLIYQGNSCGTNGNCC